ncbi:gliding motility protein GldD [Mangrovimonas yunxiaonensis]|uniref:Gliding motility protein GldD n=1 Tax=Mangrovimonas yunxiaonensis TaxID=1197477 RepID=A0A084TLB6_9FLAO|nr:gliding motility lipoprotein GldD [Mangrovimonas yunxiaonensis]KFB01502.1 gliding motility protein GldD [Mangrovimonas yunxiaonensis]MBR9758365.1 gliding motility lipoprotein GldD [Algicola sp.]GGH36296.1 gliding motility lipoprotein GldD [Mangrovimonas yunxiaonensis]
MKKASFLGLISALMLLSCGEDPLPKPKAYLRLDYPEPKYNTSKLDLPLTFEMNELVSKKEVRLLEGETQTWGVNLDYQKLQGTIYLTYKSIAQDKDRLITFLRDAQKFTQEHTRKADEIVEQPYINPERNVYGMLYEVGGNAASQSQFYVTDSLNHFLTGSLYFYAKPNYDSILPAAKYLENDIKRIMESVKWK